MKSKIIKLRLEGKSYNEISEILGCSKSTISYHCSKLDKNSKIKSSNLDIKNKRQIKDESFLLPNIDTISKVISLRKEKKNYKEISNELSIKVNSVSKICRKYELSLNRKFSDLSKETIEKIVSSYNELKSTRKVANLLGISRDSVMKYISIEKKDKLTEDELKKNNSKNVIEWRKRTKQKLVEYKGGSCSRCGYSKCLSALEFHHLDPTQKDFSISGKSWSFERLKIEVDKCILVCANCHVEIHQK